MESSPGSLAGEMQLTHIERQNIRLKSQYGEIPYLEWCLKEAQRINKSRHAKHARVYLNGGQLCCVVVSVTRGGTA
jgi:hypothetical protein